MSAISVLSQSCEGFVVLNFRPTDVGSCLDVKAWALIDDLGMRKLPLTAAEELLEIISPTGKAISRGPSA